MQVCLLKNHEFAGVIKKAMQCKSEMQVKQFNMLFLAVFSLMCNTNSYHNNMGKHCLLLAPIFYLTRFNELP